MWHSSSILLDHVDDTLPCSFYAAYRGKTSGAVGRSKPVSCLQQVGLGAARLVGGPQNHLAAVAGFRATARLPAVGGPGPSLLAVPPGAGPLRARAEPRDLQGPMPR